MTADTLTLVTFRVDGSITEQQFDPMNYLALRRAVGGPLEIVPFFDMVEHRGIIHKCVAFCDEHGKLNGKPLNRKADERWQRLLTERGLDLNDWLAGDIAFVFGDPALMAEL